jgi:CRP-like cAMP-binding protein
LRRLLRQATTVEYARGETLFRQGDPAAHFFVVFEGWVKVYRLTRAGNEAVVGVFSKGQSFAEAAAFLQGEYPASAEAAADCRLLRLPTGSLIDWVHEAPELGLAMLASTSRHLHALVQQIEQLKARTGTQRVAEFLSDLCPVEDGACTIGLPYDKALIAGRLGMKPESLSRAFARLRPLGVVIDHNTAAISDVASLRGFVDEEQPYLDSELGHG